MEPPIASETTIPLRPVASPLNERFTKVPHPAGMVEPVYENANTVEPPALTKNPAS